MSSALQYLWPSVTVSEENRPLLRQSACFLGALALVVFGLVCAIALIGYGLDMLKHHQNPLSMFWGEFSVVLAYLDLVWLKQGVPFVVLAALVAFSVSSYLRIQIGLYDLAQKPLLSRADVDKANHLQRVLLADSWNNILVCWYFMFVVVMAFGATVGAEFGPDVDPNVSFSQRRVLLLMWGSFCMLFALYFRSLCLPHVVEEGALKDNDCNVYWAHEVGRRFDLQESQLEAKKVLEPAPVLVPQHPLFHEEPAPAPVMSDSLKKILDQVEATPSKP